MQHLQAISQKFVIEGQNQTEIFIYHPLNDATHKLGNLYILGEVETFGQRETSKIFLLNALASIIKKTYYSFSDQSDIFNVIALTLRKTSIHFKSTLKNFKGVLHLLVIFAAGNKIFFAKTGRANIWLIRRGKWTLISQISGAGKKTHQNVLFNQVFNGTILPNDTLIAVTPKIIPYIMQEPFKIKVTSLPFESTLSFLKKNIKDIDPGASAAILKIDFKEAPYSPEKMSFELREEGSLAAPIGKTSSNGKEVNSLKTDRLEAKFTSNEILKHFYPFVERKAALLSAKKSRIFAGILLIAAVILTLAIINGKTINQSSKILSFKNNQPHAPEAKTLNYLNSLSQYNLIKLADLKTLGFAFSPQVMINNSGAIWLFDRRLAIKLNLNDNSLITTFLDLPFNSNFSGALFPFTNNIFLIESNNPSAVTLFNITDNNFKTYQISFPEKNLLIKDISIYASNLYFLAENDSLIYKAPVSLSFSVGQAQKWLKDSAVKISGVPLSLAIDSNLYLLDSSGAVTKFFKGKKTAAFENKTGVSIGAEAKIYTDVAFKNLYIADPQSNRLIILSKDGKNFSQIVNQALEGVRLISISPDEKTIYASSSSGIYQISF